MTKDKILSAEEFLWKFIMTKTGTPETDMASIEDMSKTPEFSKLVGMLNDYADQFHPPTMTEEELRKEAEREYPYYPNQKNIASEDTFTHNEITILERQAHIKARKMGAIKMDRETAETIWNKAVDSCVLHCSSSFNTFDQSPQHEHNFSEIEIEKQSFLKSINQ